jgi:hypothetical protein
MTSRTVLEDGEDLGFCDVKLFIKESFVTKKNSRMGWDVRKKVHDVIFGRPSKKMHNVITMNTELCII